MAPAIQSCAVSGARIADAWRIIAIDIETKRVDAAKRFGATDIIDSTKSEPVEAVRNPLPHGADHVFDFVGLKSVSEQGLAMLGTGGLYLVGVARPDVEIGLNIVSAIGGQKRVQGVRLNLPRATSRCTQSCTCKMVQESAIKTLTTHYIDGGFVESRGHEVMDIISPTRGKAIGRVTLAEEKGTRRDRRG